MAVDVSSNNDKDEDDVIADELWESIKKNLTLNQKFYISHKSSIKPTTTTTTTTTTTSTLSVSLKVFDFGPFIIGIKPGQYDPQDYTLIKTTVAKEPTEPIQNVLLVKNSKVTLHLEK